MEWFSKGHTYGMIWIQIFFQWWSPDLWLILLIFTVEKCLSLEAYFDIHFKVSSFSFKDDWVESNKNAFNAMLLDWQWVID